jgi:hypothetical protein
MTEFMCYYFTQRDGTSGSALKNDLENLVNLISSCTLMLHDQPGVKPSIPPVLRSLLTNGNFDQPIFDLIKGHFDYGNPPDQDNGTPPPAWDINPNNPPTYQMSYGIDYNFLLASDQNLAQWIQQYQEAG